MHAEPSAMRNDFMNEITSNVTLIGVAVMNYTII